MLKLQIYGNLGKDAEIKEFGEHKVIKFSVAHTTKFKNKAGNLEERTTWVNCNVWNRSEKILEYLKKGTRVFCEGEPSANGYISKDGEGLASLEINVNNLEF